jgi:hypothetical protein
MFWYRFKCESSKVDRVHHRPTTTVRDTFHDALEHTDTATDWMTTSSDLSPSRVRREVKTLAIKIETDTHLSSVMASVYILLLFVFFAVTDSY